MIPKRVFCLVSASYKYEKVELHTLSPQSRHTHIQSLTEFTHFLQESDGGIVGAVTLVSISSRAFAKKGRAGALPGSHRLISEARGLCCEKLDSAVWLNSVNEPNLPVRPWSGIFHSAAAAPCCG